MLPGKSQGVIVENVLHQVLRVVLPQHQLGKVGKCGNIRNILRQITAVHIASQRKVLFCSQGEEMLDMRQYVFRGGVSVLTEKMAIEIDADDTVGVQYGSNLSVP